MISLKKVWHCKLRQQSFRKKSVGLVHCDLMMIWFDGQFVVLPLGRVGKNLLDNTGQVPW